ncbi:hypothetical protein PVK06_045729 [Gossypium arboreum]|uniref:Secreted protein n=1 Tax=Gossypium arboreum TaxID=29729 RepID=A0ABR0MUV8_GOSAR|nr:hypothetical protein PVK06_045729 [Gossypium arboreum]
MATRLCCSSLVATTSQSLARKTLNENMGEKRGKTNPTKASPKRQTTTDEANSEERAKVSAMHRLYYVEKRRSEKQTNQKRKGKGLRRGKKTRAVKGQGRQWPCPPTPTW